MVRHVVGLGSSLQVLVIRLHAWCLLVVTRSSCESVGLGALTSSFIHYIYVVLIVTRASAVRRALSSHSLQLHDACCDQGF